MVAFASDLPDTNKWNLDETTFQSHAVGHGDYALVKMSRNGADDLQDGEEDGVEGGAAVGNRHTEVTSLATPNDLSVFVKYMFMGNAHGESAPLVFIVVLKKMPPGEFFFEPVVGLSADTGIGTIGYLYACQSRAGNAALWTHYFLHIVIPTIKHAVDVHGAMVWSNF